MITELAFVDAVLLSWSLRGWFCRREADHVNVSIFYHLSRASLNPSEDRLVKNQAKSNYFLYSAWVFYVTEPDQQRNTSTKKFNIFSKSFQPPVVGRFISRAHHWYETRTFTVSTREKSISERAFALHINPGWYGPHFVSFLYRLMFYFMLRFSFFTASLAEWVLPFLEFFLLKRVRFGLGLYYYIILLYYYYYNNM